MPGVEGSLTQEDEIIDNNKLHIAFKFWLTFQSLPPFFMIMKELQMNVLMYWFLLDVENAFL